MNTLEGARAYLDTVLREGMARHRTPAVTVAWTDRERSLHVAVWGVADPVRGVALTPDHLFNFGSIGKSFTCIALLQAEEKGLVDLQAPVTQYLPWFTVQSNYRPITLHDLMTHSSGLPQGTDQETEALGEVWNLRHVHTGFPPGEQFYYSNSGYKTLGLVLEKVYGKPYPEIIQAQILNPLGLKNTIPALTFADQPRFAQAFMPCMDDRPARRDADLTPVPWIESATADGCISSNAEDLAAYTRMLLNRGQGPEGTIFSEESFAKMIQPYQQRTGERAYGYGMMSWEEDGFHCVGHSGSIPGYLAFMRLDLDNGLGAVMLMAEPVLEGVSELAMQVLRAGMLGRDMPPNPFEQSPLKVENPEHYAGIYRGDVRAFEIRVDEDRLVMAYQDRVFHLEPHGGDAFLVYDPDFELFPLNFGREVAEDEPGPVVEAFYGGEWFRGERYAGALQFDVPAGWAAYTGHYRAHNIWSTNFRVVIRKGALWLVHPDGRAGLLEPLEGGDFLIRYADDDVHVERLAFDALVDGKAVIACYSGADYYRFFTP